MFADWSDKGDWPAKRDSFIDEDLSRRLLYGVSAHLLVNVGCDDVFPLANLFDKPIDLYGLMDGWNQNEKPAMRMSTPYRFHDAVKGEALPTVEGPLDPCDVAFNIPVRSRDSIWRARFETEKLILTAEKLGFMLEAMGGKADWETAGRLWDKLSGFSGHAIEWLLEEDFEEMLGLSRSVRHEAKTLIADTLDGMASRSKVYGETQYIVVNTEPYARRELVQMHITTPCNVNGLKLVDGHGNELPYQVTELYDGDKAYVGREYNEVKAVCLVTVPAMGAAAVIAENGGGPMAEAVRASLPDENAVPPGEVFIIDNGLFAVTFAGGLPVLITDQTGFAIYDRERHGCFAAFVFHHTEPPVDWSSSYDDVSTDEFATRTVRYTERGPLRHAVELLGDIGGRPAYVKIRIERGSPRIDFDFTVEHDGSEGYFTAGVPCDASPDVIAGVPFGAESRDTGKILYKGDLKPLPGDELFDYERGMPGGFYAHGFAAYNFNGWRCALLQGNCSTFYRNRRGSSVMEMILMRSVELSKRADRWLKHIHPSFEGKGAQSFSFSVCMLPGGASLVNIRREAGRAENPLLCRPRYSREAGQTETPFSAMRIEGGSLCLSAVYAEGDEWVWRMYECAGLMGESRIVTALPAAGAYVADLLGRPLRGRAEVKAEGCGAFVVSYAPYEIITIRVKRGGNE